MSLLMKPWALRCAASSVLRCFRRFAQSSSKTTWWRRIHQLREKQTMCMYFQGKQLHFARANNTRLANEDDLVKGGRKTVWRGTPIPERSHNDVYFPEEENEHFHLVLEKIPEYRDKLLYFTDSSEIPLVGTAEDSSNVLQALDDLSIDLQNEIALLERLSRLPQSVRHTLLEDSRFKSLCFSTLSRVENLSDQEFFKMLQVLSAFGFRRAIHGETRTFRLSVHSMVMEDCDRRSRKNDWNLQQLFLAADFQFATRCSALRRSSSVLDLHNTVENRLRHLSKTELVLFMYHCCVSRQIAKSAVPQILEKVLFEFDALNFDEVAVICLALFKSNNTISMPQFLTKLSQRLDQDMAAASPLALSAVFKTLCKSTDKNTSRYNSDFQEVLVSLLDKSTVMLADLPFSTSIHIFRFFLGVHWMSEAFLSVLIEAVLKDDISAWRVKEISRFLFHLCNFTCFSEHPKFQLVVERLLGQFCDQRRRNEFQMFPESLLQGLVGLSFVNIYDEELADFLFGKDFQDLLSSQRKSLKDVNFLRDLFQLDRSLKIDRPSYRGNHLTTAVENMANIPINPDRKVPKANSIRSVIHKEVVSELVSLLGGQHYLRIGHLLPHYHTTDIEVRLGADRKPIPVSEWRTSCTTKQTSQMQHRGNLHKLLLDLSGHQKQQRLAVVMFGPNCYHVYRDKGGNSTKQLLGLHQMKLRHLALSGFTTVQIPYFEFNRADDHRSYLKHKLYMQASRQ